MKYLFITLIILLSCILLPISAISGEILLDEFNDSSVGNTNGISYVDTPNGRGAVFQCANESRIQYGFNTQIPKQGTLEFYIKIDSGYNYSNSTLNEGNSSALIFTTDIQGGDVTWPGSTWLYVSDNGTISLRISGEKYEAGWDSKYMLSVTDTEATFGEWLAIGISYGSFGRHIMLNGNLVASNINQTEQVGVGGNHSTPKDIPTIGESVSCFWTNNRYEGGFEGVVDTFRVSDTQKDWKVSLFNPSKDTVIGTVITSSDILGYNANVSGAVVTAIPYNLTTFTDASGKFQFYDIPLGDCIIQTETSYFETLTKSVQVIEGATIIDAIELVKPKYQNMNPQDVDQLLAQLKAEKDAIILEKEQRIHQLTETLNEVETIKEAQSLTIISLKNMLSENNNQLISANNTIKEYAATNAHLLTEIEEQKQIINTNQITISNLNSTVTEKLNEILQKENVINELNQQISNMYTEDELNSSVQTALAEIQTYTGYSIQLSKGWHMLSSINKQAKPKTIPDGAIDLILRYSNGAYAQTDTLIPKFGYWIKINQPCEFILTDLELSQ